MSRPKPSTAAATAARLAVALATLAWLLAACGPGVGGSGTGEDQTSALPVFGASAASLCGSEFATLLACGTPPSAAPNVGTSALAFVGTLGGVPASLRLQGNQADLRVGCVALRFRGEWGRLGSQAPRFYGYLDHDGTAVVATMEARLVGAAIELTLRDVNGSVLFGPILVTAGEAHGCP
jgi:hypothetical protein